MSYDVSIFFSDIDSNDIYEVAQSLNEYFGLSLMKFDDGVLSFESNVFFLNFSLFKRRSFLTDTSELKFSKYSYQLDITSHLGAIDIIHPVSLSMTIGLSKKYKSNVMLCLSGVECLGAIYKNGNLVVNNIDKYPELYAGTHWSYKK